MSKFLEPNEEEKNTIRQIITDLLRNQPMTLYELVGIVFNEPYCFDKGFGSTSALTIISKIFSELHDADILAPVFCPDEESIMILVKWTLK